MALSSGTRQAASMAAGWVLAAACTATSIVYFSEIQNLAQSLFGLQPGSAPRVVVERHRGSADQDRVIATAGPMVELRAGAYGHYRTSAEINGRAVDVLVDTGASMVALTFEDARAMGLFMRDADFTHRVSTANGYARIAPVTLDRISIGGITVRNVSGAVMESGKLATTLLGMSFLGRLQRVDMRSGTLILQE